jgi:hypothetical protein
MPLEFGGRCLRKSSLGCLLLLANFFLLACCRLMAQATSSPLSNAVLLERKYRPGEVLSYEMKGSNQGWEYQIQANGLVRKDAEGVSYEEIGWSNLRSNASMTLSPSSLAFRQSLSLESKDYLKIPDLSKVQPFLIGPITDLLTFYSDLFLAKQMKLTQVGQHIHFQHGKPNSWADGQRVLIGQDAIDFDLTLLDEDTPQHTATLLIQHVPPHHPQVQLPAKWMATPVGDAANNWVQVVQSGDKYLAQVGEEVFEVHIKIDTRDGKIMSAQLHNPVTSILRECEDAALSKCGKPKPNNILREVSLTLKP